MLEAIEYHIERYGEWHSYSLVLYNKDGVFACGQELITRSNLMNTARDNGLLVAR